MFSDLNGIIGVIHLILVIYTLYVLITGKKPKYLNKIIWVIVIVVIPVLGPILYWIFEKKILG